MYHFPFMKDAQLDKDSGLTGGLTDVWLALPEFYLLQVDMGKLCL